MPLESSFLYIEYLDKWAQNLGWVAYLLTAAAAGAGLIAWFFTLALSARKDERSHHKQKDAVELQQELKRLNLASLWTGSIAVFLTAGAATAGLMSWSFSSAVGAMKDDRARKLEKEALDAKVELARLRKAQGPRMLNIVAFKEKLKGTLRREVEILYQSGDVEAHWLADQIFSALPGSVWSPPNWLVSYPRPIPSHASRADLQALPSILFNAIPPIERITASPFGISIIGNKSPSGEDAPQKPLADAILAGGLGVATSVNSALPDNKLLLIVGPKP
ncbi:hypothetical protein YTPLAS72_31770 [Nitrospira sp.]|nr:hypothetical protein YTPLAS72_31770 [Nitrospira sp.]